VLVVQERRTACGAVERHVLPVGVSRSGGVVGRERSQKVLFTTSGHATSLAPGTQQDSAASRYTRICQQQQLCQMVCRVEQLVEHMSRVGHALAARNANARLAHR
jgi:hypothetical protein